MKRKPFNPVTRRYYVGKRLIREEALREAERQDRKAGYVDYRGFTYNPRTGEATLT